MTTADEKMSADKPLSLISGLESAVSLS